MLETCHFPLPDQTTCEEAYEALAKHTIDQESALGKMALCGLLIRDLAYPEQWAERCADITTPMSQKGCHDIGASLFLAATRVNDIFAATPSSMLTVRRPPKPLMHVALGNLEVLVVDRKMCLQNTRQLHPKASKGAVAHTAHAEGVHITAILPNLKTRNASKVSLHVATFAEDHYRTEAGNVLRHPQFRTADALMGLTMAGQMADRFLCLQQVARSRQLRRIGWSAG